MYRWKNTVNVHWRYRWLCNPWTYVDHIYLCKQAVIYELLCISLILQHNALLLSWQLFSCLIYTAGKIISTHSTLSITSPTSPLSSCSNGPVSVWFGGGGNTVAESHTHSLAPLQERHQGGCGERGKRICPNVAHCWKQSTCIRKTLTFVLRCIMLTPPAFDFIATEALQRDWLPPHTVCYTGCLHVKFCGNSAVLLSSTKGDWFSLQNNNGREKDGQPKTTGSNLFMGK